jgi:hypothetical protein
MSMRWKDIDFSQKRWRIPDTKNEETQIIPFNECAMERPGHIQKNAGVQSISRYFAEPKK